MEVACGSKNENEAYIEALEPLKFDTAELVVRLLTKELSDRALAFRLPPKACLCGSSLSVLYSASRGFLFEYFSTKTKI